MKKFTLSCLLVFSSVLATYATGHVATAIGTNPTCNGSCDGSAVAMASGGIGPYGYTWTGPASYTATGANLSGLCAGTYIVTAIDSSDMSTAMYTLNLTEPAAVLVSVNSATTCLGTGPVTLLATGATTYVWSTGATTNPIIVTPATTTSYTVTGTTAGCTATAVATVTVNAPPVVTLFPLPDACGTCSGSITTSAAGAMTYSWVGPGYVGTTMNAFALCPGTYTLTATGLGGCSTTATATVIPSPLVVATVSTTPASCGACDGTATVTATGGTPPYIFSWSIGATTSTITGLCPGTYTVTVTDGNGCTSTALGTVASTSSITAMTSATPTGCGVCNGSANVTATGGTGGYTYDWAPGAPTGDGTTGISNLCLGSYTVTVTDGAGCSSTALATITNTTPIVATAVATPSACGVCNGTVSVFESGGTAPYVYDLTGFPQQTNGNFSGVCPGTYVATVTDVNGCIGIYTIVVNSVNSTSFAVTSVTQNETGSGLSNGFIDLTITGSAPPYTFLWSNGATTEDIYSLAGGMYSVTITDNNGECAMYTFLISTIPAYGYITGYVYNDTNTNCVFDAGDSPIAGYYVTVTSGTATYYGYTNASGYYSVWVPNGSYTVTPTTLTDLEAACTASYPVTVTSGSTSLNNNFAYTLPPIYDVCITTYSTGIVPGFNGGYYTTLHNYGTQTAIGEAYLVLPSILNYVSSSPLASSISGDTIFWNYTINPFTAQFFSVTFYTPPTTPLGTVTMAHVNATVTNGTDINPGCNNYVYTRVVTGSFDPNAKTVSPSGYGATGNIGLTETEFTYLVQFQNTGSGPAVNINVTDTISSMLDLLSFEMLEASHSYVVEFLPGNVIRWKFDNIMLPDSTSNEPGSHGHVLFRMSKAAAPAYGEVIENKVFIYFDFNAPVITNTAINTYAMPMSIEGQTSENGKITVYPNPFTDNATFVVQSDNLNEMYSFELTDILGKKVKVMNGISQKQFEISRADLQNGIYFYRIYTAESIIGIGKVIIK